MSADEAFPIDAAQIVGVYLVTFVNCLKTLLWFEGGFKAGHKLHIKMIVAAHLMFIFATLDVAFHLRDNLDAFVGAPNSESVIAHFNDTSNWINVMKMVSYVLQTFVGDSILLYRCWIIHNCNWWIIVFPTFLWLGCTVCGAMTIYVEATLDTEGALLNAKNLIPFITSMLCLTLAMNSLTTGLIVYRIWKIQRQLKRRGNFSYGSSPLSRLLVVLIESGLMYTLSIVILFILYMAGNNGQYGVSNAVVQIIGITFNLIITSVDRGSSHSPGATHSVSGSRSNIQVTSNRLALHQIHVQTTTARFPEFQDEEAKVSTGTDASSTWK